MTLVIIPARMASTRLPGKPLLKIGDKTIIERCVEQAKKAGFEPIVATDADVTMWPFLNCEIVKTGDCASGTDRVAAAAEILDPEGKHEFVINYQGDMPFLDPDELATFVTATEQGWYDILTGTHLIEVVEFYKDEFRRKQINCHIGLYGFKREALRRFAALPPSEAELEQRLEQLRSPHDQFKWGGCNFDVMPIEINTQADLERARSCLM